MVRVIPVSDDRVAALLKSGRPAKELAKKWGVQAQTVYKAANAGGYRPGHDTQTLLPFKLSGPRTYTTPARCLRSLARLRQGEELRQDAWVALRNWQRERDAEGTVVEYHEDAPPNRASKKWGGWYYAPRRPETPADEYYQERSPATPDGEYFLDATQK